MRSSFDSGQIRDWFAYGGIPLTKILAVSNIVTFLVISLWGVAAIPALLGFTSETFLLTPWTVLTYPFVGSCGGILCLVFSIFWLWVAGGSLERAWGTRRFTWFFFTMCAIAALGLLCARVVTGRPTVAMGLWLPLAGVTMAFAMLNPEQEILFMLLIPLKMKYLAVIDVVAVLINYGSGAPLVGVFALAGCAYAYWYVRGAPRLVERRPRGQVVRVRQRESIFSKLNPLRAMKDRKERDRLRKLFKDSGMDE